MMMVVDNVGPEVGTAPICRALGVARSTVYRRRNARHEPAVEHKPRPKPARALLSEECQQVPYHLLCHWIRLPGNTLNKIHVRGWSLLLCFDLK